MQVVCEATQSPSIPVQVAAFECLVRIMGLYYDKMGFYMERALFGVSLILEHRLVNSVLKPPRIAYSSWNEKSERQRSAAGRRILVYRL